MATINQLISEIAHITGQPNNVPFRRNIRELIIHTRNELIRQSYSNHSYIDKGLQQRFVCELESVKDADLYKFNANGIKHIKRSKNKIPRPVRLINNLPFNSIRTLGSNNVEIPFIKEANARFTKHLAGLCNLPCYDYINDYLYIFNISNKQFANLNSIVIEAAFEYPHLIEVETNEDKKDTSNYNIDNYDIYDNDEFLIPEDMVGQLMNIIMQRNLLTIVRETNETPKNDLVK